MASRRGLGQGLMAAGDWLGQYFQRQQNQQEVARREKENILLRNGLQDQDNSQKLIAEIVKGVLSKNPQTAAKFAGITLDNRDAAGPVSEEISKTKTPSDALTNQDVEQRYLNSGGRETLDSRNFSNG